MQVSWQPESQLRGTRGPDQEGGILQNYVHSLMEQLSCQQDI